MKQTIKGLILFSSLLFFHAHSVEINKDVDFLNLSVGFQYEHDLPEAYRGKRLRFEGTYVRFTSISYQKSQNKLLFNPRRKGQGTLIIKNTKNKILQKIHVDVRLVNLHKIVKDVESLLSTVDGIEIKIVNGKVIIDGQVLLPKEVNRIDSVAEEYGGLVRSFVTLSPKAQLQLARFIEKEIGYLIPPDEVRVKVAHNRFILEGEVTDKSKSERAEFIANLYTQFDAEKQGINVRRKQIHSVTNLIKIRTQKQDERKKIIQIIVHYVELQKSYNKGFAFQWAPSIEDGTNVTANYGKSSPTLNTLVTATISNFFPKLNWAKSFNFARILHNASITLEEGKEGSIVIDTKTPYTVRKGDGEISVSSATAKVVTVVTPQIMGPNEETVHMKINVEVASLGGTTDDGPIVNSRKIKTSLHVRSGLSAVLGGLISSHLSKDYNRLPGNSVKTPIINLLSSKNYDTSKGQFVVFITPSIKGSASVGVREIKRKFKLDGN